MLKRIEDVGRDRLKEDGKHGQEQSEWGGGE
jgi:hypothetical protein